VDHALRWVCLVESTQLVHSKYFPENLERDLQRQLACNRLGAGTGKAISGFELWIKVKMSIHFILLRVNYYCFVHYFSCLETVLKSYLRKHWKPMSTL
jgi:hypothetical protein